MLAGADRQRSQIAFERSFACVEKGHDLHQNPRLKTGSNDDRTAAKRGRVRRLQELELKNRRRTTTRGWRALSFRLVHMGARIYIAKVVGALRLTQTKDLPSPKVTMQVPKVTSASVGVLMCERKVRAGVWQAGDSGSNAGECEADQTLRQQRATSLFSTPLGHHAGRKIDVAQRLWKKRVCGWCGTGRLITEPFRGGRRGNKIVGKYHVVNID
jgi:hypothetical protein